jgi:SAM-dependent methyltransferase
LFACDFTKNRTVLDVGCGLGYGTALVGMFGQPDRLLGVDTDAGSIAFAKENRSLGSMGIKFTQSDFLAVNSSFNVIIAFEIIEHLKNPVGFIEHVWQLLSQDGILLLSTPNKKITSPFTKTPLNPHHIHEFTHDELYPLLRRHFPRVIPRGQRFVPRFLCTRKIRTGVRVLEKIARRDFGIYSTIPSAEVRRVRPNEEPRCLIYECRK